MIRFIYPELFLLALPLGWAYWRFGRASGITGALRILALVLLVLAMTGPLVNLGGEGMDLVVVIDRSRSLPDGAEARMKELIRTLEASRRRGDRLALVTFGAQAQTEQLLDEQAHLDNFKKEVLPDGSDLQAALQQALDLVKDGNRPARILVFSDGEANGPRPATAARRARDLGVPVDFREFPRLREGDVAVESLQLPDVVAPREPFQYSVYIQSERAGDAKVTVLREGKQIASANRTLSVGRNRLLFRDLLEEGGRINYEVRVEMDGDPLAENNRGTAVTKVEAGPRVLVLNNDGSDGNFVKALRAGRIPVDVSAASAHPLSRDSLDRYRAVILENVPAGALGRAKMERLAQYVEDLGGGLMLTGGMKSFGTGGYFKSPLDDVLPVSMEMREEHRKTRIAIAVALDRSGSMAVPVKGGKVKMDLANLGTVECVKMLSAADSIAVIAVDSAPHTIQPLTAVDDVEAISRKVLGIQSMGGGIFVYEALVAAGNELINAEQATKHIILFSDANDSEEPGDYANLLKKYEAAGITVSVIGLGTKSDVDAKLLEDVAKLGKGNIMFSDDPEELPRLFTEDTMSVARSSFIQADPATQPNGIPGRMTADIRLIGEMTSGTFPSAGGYNLSYLKPEATMGVVSQDEYQAPWSAFWYRGLGRVAAITLEVDGQNTGAFGTWSEYADFCITHTRWLLGNEAPGEAFVKLSRDGQDAIVTLELDEQRAKVAGAQTAPTLMLIPPGSERTTVVPVPFQWRGPATLEARYRLSEAGTFRGVVVSGGKILSEVPAITLPYSPEFMPRAGLQSGRETLLELAEIANGKERTSVDGMYLDAPRSSRMRSLIPWLVLASVVTLVVEVAGRRLALWPAIEKYLANPLAGLEGPLKGIASESSKDAAQDVSSSAPLPKRGWWTAAPRVPQADPLSASTSAPATPASAEPAKPAVPAAKPADVFAKAKLKSRQRN